MKKTFLYILIFTGIISAQSVEVISIKNITNLDEGKFYYPVGNNDDSKIIFSSDNYKGFWMLDNNSGEIEQVNNYVNSGYEPRFTDDNKIIFRNDNFQNGRRYISIYEYDIENKNETLVEKNLRNIAQLKIVDGNKIAYSQNKNLQSLKTEENLEKSSINEQPVVMVEDFDLVLYREGEREVINPLGKGNYLWASVSPKGDKLLFTFAGKGSFITDLSGKIINELGYAHYPQWSNDGEWIVYMKDYDDGYNVVESDLFLYSVINGDEFQITDTKDVHEMYPVWAKSKSDIYCNSTDGIIYKIELKLN